MATGNNVQIPFPLFRDTFRYFFFGAGREDDSPEADAIRRALQDKLVASKKRNLYTRSKDPRLTPAEREEARQQYLDLVGITDSFRWSQQYAEQLLQEHLAAAKNPRNAGTIPKFSDREKDEIVAAVQSGRSYRDVATEYRCSVGLVHNLITEQQKKKERVNERQN